MRKQCRDIEADLPDLASGRLDANRATEVKTHLASCSACRSDYEELKNTFAALGEAKPFAEPGTAYWSSFGPRLRESMEARNETTRHVPGWVLRYLLPGAAAAAALLLVLRTGTTVKDTSDETLQTIVNELSNEEKLSLLHESISTPQEAIAEYTVSDSVVTDFRNELKANVLGGTIDESTLVPYDQQYTPEVLIESLPPDEADRVLSKLESQQSITS